MSKQETVTVKIPKVTANFIQKQKWFELYDNLTDFVMEGVRQRMETWMRLK